MCDQTLGLIYEIKKNGILWTKAVAEYMSKETNTPIEMYDEWTLNDIMMEAFVDYVATCDNPVEAVRTLLESMKRVGYSSIGHHISDTLILTRVKKDGEFVNGFREMEEK